MSEQGNITQTVAAGIRDGRKPPDPEPLKLIVMPGYSAAREPGKAPRMLTIRELLTQAYGRKYWTVRNKTDVYVKMKSALGRSRWVFLGKTTDAGTRDRALRYMAANT